MTPIRCGDTLGTISGPGVQKIVRILLRDTAKDLYPTAVGGWTRNPDQGFDFGTASHAIAFAQEKRIEKPELIYSFHDPAYDIRIPLRPQR